MKNTTKFVLSVFALTAGLMATNALTTDANSNGAAAPVSRTGSPGDGASCTSCHTGTAAATVAGLITSTIPASGYIPGQTYVITGSITQAGKTKFGFEISPQNLTGVKKGTLAVTSTTTTQLIGSGKYITHKAAGTSFPSGTATWSFNWTAPAAGTGDLTFYGAFNVTNANNADTGDQIKLSTLLVHEDVSAGIADALSISNEINVFPNPVEDKLNIISPSTDLTEVSVSIINMQGQLVKKVDEFSINSFINVEELSTGYYILKIETERGIAVKKIVKK
jgi:hypothetical protein